MKKFYGSTGSFPEYWTVKHFCETVCVVTDSEKRAKLFYHDAQVYARHLSKRIELSIIPSETDILDTDSQIKRNYALYSVLKKKNSVVVMDRKALDIPVRKVEQFLNSTITVEEGKEINREYLIDTLLKNGYIREEIVENTGEFSVKGGFISVHIPFTGLVEIHLFGDFVENIYIKSKLGTRKKIKTVDIFPLYDFPVKADGITLQFEKTEDTKVSEYLKDINRYYIDVHTAKDGKVYFFSTGSSDVVGSIKDREGLKEIKLPLRQPLVLKDEKLFFSPSKEETLQIDFEPLEEGDYVVHEDYGIGIYRGIETRNIKGKNYDFMILEYAGGEKVYLSYLHFDKIFKYRASGTVELDTIGGTSWRNLKKRVKGSLKKIAKQLLKLYAERKSTKRKPYIVDDELIKKFESSFPYVETPDQMKAIIDVKNDMASDTPMERIICGDVGFGKTEVALRAVFIAVFNGKQVAVLTPTTVLSFQHYRNFKERLEPFGVRVENLSRLKTRREIGEILEKLRKGQIDVIIGTHRVLQDDVKFKDLGLLIIDEEHRFGVRAKEKIRTVKKDVDTLYLSATPIPRTLSMALSGFKEISVIRTPPEGRLETKTYVSTYSEDVIKKAVNFELNRNGQVFYLFNRIDKIEEKAKQLKDMFPDASIEVAHGKLKPKQIEKRIIDFIQKKIDILVSTSIIETGIDIPSANTLIIERADLFGLAQLYHLRGRVGRGNIQAYCYLLLPERITDDAQKRIDAVLRFTRPGSGLKISMEDMRIRGAGNILGVEQSGYLKAVGYEMYIKLLQETLHEEAGSEEKMPIIHVNLDSYIPDSFIKDPSERMNLYMIVSKADISEIEQIREYLNQFYSKIPEAVSVYLNVEKLKKAAKNRGFKKIEISKDKAVITFEQENPPSPDVIDGILRHFGVIDVSATGISIHLNREDIGRLAELISGYSSISTFAPSVSTSRTINED
ncbi:DEAD/DEAH box helicase [Persephonella atlantica]|uniref:Transcription-repair-coupling factor n=1 Tax=Persephonella atlantica TaxID=2699429 RepID=A0ABS1GF98_9AQUI|nr:DEAD/DEAH box helicase [Persephonella atlantica]MBK3331550.1 DEAD/DEAH box helicase [Persephonella atlantica]